MPQTQLITGSYVSDGQTKFLNLVSDVDYFELFNYTKILANAAGNPGVAKRAWWQRGMPNGSFMCISNTAGAATDSLTGGTTGGFTLIDSTLQTTGPITAVTSVTNVTPPVVATGSTAGLANGDVVRITNAFSAGATLPYSGLDFTIGAVTLNTSFTLAYMTAAGAATSGNWRKINFDPIYYPRRRIITKVRSVGVTTVVTMSVTHGYQVGQRVRFIVPATSGMIQLNGLVGLITAVGVADADGITNTITVNIDSSGFTAFQWPTLAVNLAFTPAEVVPIADGPSTVANLNADQSVLTGATVNQGFRGMMIESVTLGGGSIGSNVGGVANDVIYWQAHKSTEVISP